MGFRDSPSCLGLKIRDGRSVEKPVHGVKLDAFYMDAYEVSKSVQEIHPSDRIPRTP